MSKTLTVWCPWPQQPLPPRMESLLEKALDGVEYVLIKDPEAGPAAPGPVLFVLALDEYGTNPEYHRLLRTLRRSPRLLEGCVGGLVVDGDSELYTKAMGRELVFTANMAGCAFLGRPLVEATGSLENFRVQAGLLGTDLQGAYLACVKELAQRLMEFEGFRPAGRPNLLVLHASNRATSNTMALWHKVRDRLEGCSITEIGLRNGTLEDCAGCAYRTCLHFGEQGSCFYGGVMVQDVYPAVKEADAVMMLCPNYNDAVSANLTAFINRLTALFRTRRFYDKALFGLVVSGYSGSDLVAQQLISAMNMNKSFYLPPRFCLMETANDMGAALKLEGIDSRTAAFGDGLARCLGMER
ncbi:MAG: NAD(P)H-dependent oxidoreductase [Oscillospiraceae bacterium]|nr:NAD(P)H-dependent oxidoreductase [Oscillospiraceae bacterium]